MKFEEIKELVDIISKSDLTKLEIEDDGFKIKLCKDKEIVKQDRTVSYVEAPIVKEHVKEKVDQEQSQPQEDENVSTVVSPIVGTYYEAPSPDDKPYVKVGSKVKQGDTLCIIEAMKLMNDIASEVDGEVVEILVKNEDMVEYGQPIMKIKKG